MKAALLFTFACFASALHVQAQAQVQPQVQSQQAERALKVELPKANASAVFSLRDAITFNIILTAKSVEDQNALERVTVDDWRYDEPNYFSDGRVPNVILHLERKAKDGHWVAVPFSASSQGGGVNGDKLECDVNLRVSSGSTQVQTALMLQLAKKAMAEKKSDADLQQEIVELQKLFRGESIGDFRLTATYSGTLRGSGRQIVKAPPIEFTVRDAP